MRPDEFDSLSPNRIWNFIAAHQEREKEQWERTRVISFNVAKFGNSDPKKFPRSMFKFWPFPWDGKEAKSDYKTIYAQHAQMKAMRQELEKKKKYG